MCLTTPRILRVLPRMLCKTSNVVINHKNRFCVPAITGVCYDHTQKVTTINRNTKFYVLVVTGAFFTYTRNCKKHNFKFNVNVITGINSYTIASSNVSLEVFCVTSCDDIPSLLGIEIFISIIRFWIGVTCVELHEAAP